MKQYLKKIHQILGKWIWHYIIAAILLIFSMFFRTIEPKILQFTIDNILNSLQNNNNIILPPYFQLILQKYFPFFPINNLSNLLILATILYIIISALRGCLLFLSNTLTALSTEKSIQALRNNLFNHLQALPISYFSTINTGELIQRCTGDVETIRKFILNQIVDIVWMVSLLFLAFYMMATIHLTYAIFSIILMPIILIQSYLFFKKEGKLWEKHELEQDKLISIVEENLSGIRVVQAFAKQDFEIEKFDQQNKKKLDIGLQHGKLHAFFWPLSDFFIHLQTFLTILIGSYYVLQQKITIGQLAAFYSYAQMITWPIRRLGQVVSQLGMSKVAVERLSSIIDVSIEDYSGENTPNQRLKGDIEFKNVSFKYPNEQNNYILKNVSFKINAGEKVALIGATGSGKSTIISLLLRLYDPNEGEILIDNKPINNYSKSLLRSRIGTVLQKPFLFSTTLRNNIAYANIDASDELVIKAAEQAQIHQIVNIFLDGYQTILGEKGVNLSGGQQQRTALARTLMQNGDVLILDDSTSAVDIETELDIQKNLEQYTKTKTVIIVAHRITSIKNAQRIIILNNGTIIDQGTHKQLLNTSEYYQKIFEMQTDIENKISKN